MVMIMRIIAVDDEKIALEGLVSAIEKAAPQAEIFSFQKGEDALSFLADKPCEVAFLDIEMRGIQGIVLAQKMKLRYPHINIIFVTGYNEYTEDAFELHASGYIMKPATAEKVMRELSDLRHPSPPKGKSRLQVRAFGTFAAFIDGKPIKFSYNKTEELLAYLIDRKGVLCTNGELLSVLWEEDGGSTKHLSYLKNLRTDLYGALREAGLSDVIVRRRGKTGICTDKITCDYYEWLAGNAAGINAYTGEYMAQYSWAERTLGSYYSLGSTFF